MRKYFVKLLFLLIIFYLVSITVFTMIMHRHYKNNLMQDIQTHLHRGANLVSYLMPEGYFDRALAEDSINEDEYRHNTIRFSQVSHESGYKYLYALRNIDGEFYFIASTITMEDLEQGLFEPYWIKYEQVPAALMKAYTTRTKQFASYTDEWGSFFSCFLPVETKSGNFFIAGADIELNAYQAMLRKNSLNSFFKLLALSALLLPIFLINHKISSISIRSLSINAELLSAAPLKCVVTDSQGVITFANDTIKRDLHPSQSEVQGLSIRHPDLRTHPLFERIAYCIDKQTMWEGNFPIAGADGSERWEYAIINSTSIRSSTKPIYYAFSQDITTMRKHTEQLNQNNIILKYLTHSMHKLLSNPDPHQITQSVVSDMGNCLSMEALLLVRKADVHHKIIAAWHKDRAYHTLSARRIEKDSKPTQMDWESTLHSGQTIHGTAAQFPHEFLSITEINHDVPISLYPIKDDTRYWGFILAIRPDAQADASAQIADNTLITLSDSIAMAFHRFVMEDDLRNATDAKSSFLSSVSHEIRTPLHGILGMITLLNTTPLTEEQKEYLGAISTSGKQLQSLVNDVLDISRIEAGKFSLHRTPVNMRSVIFVVQNIVQFQLNEKNLTLSSNLSERLPDIIITDELRIKQILLNLVNNAIKFTHQGGIEITADMPEPGMLEIEVTDTGIGMTPEQQAKVFQPFYQIETGGTEMQGSGLGLVITRRLAQLMHGEVIVSSIHGKGTTFTVRVPVTDIDRRIN